MKNPKMKINRYIFSVCFLFLFSCGGGEESLNGPSAQKWYQFEFNEIPSSDVNSILSKQIVVGDAVRSWLKFNAAPATVERLLTKGFVVTDKQSMDNDTNGANAPSWWNIDENIEFYQYQGWNKDYPNSVAYIAYDTGRGIVYFCHSGFK